MKTPLAVAEVKVIVAMQLTKQFRLTATSESLRAAVEAKASERAATSFTGDYMLKCSVSSNTLC